MYNLSHWESPIGIISIASDGEALIRLDFTDAKITQEHTPACPIICECVRQLEQYFNGDLQVFDIPLKLEGTDFRRMVWKELMKIRYAQTCSYSDIAKIIGKPTAQRAVGGANNRNPVSIIVPCHRVIAQDGSLSGYGGGVWRKEWLLQHEKNFSKDV